MKVKNILYHTVLYWKKIFPMEGQQIDKDQVIRYFLNRYPIKYSGYKLQLTTTGLTYPNINVECSL